MTIYCPICLGDDFAPLTSLDFSNWRNDSAPALSAWRVDLQIGACATCGHVMITTPYDAALISRIYLETPQDRVFWGENMNDHLQPYRDMATFCGGSPDSAGWAVDFGCGDGNLLRVLHEENGWPADRLLGVDFNPRLPPPYRFVAANLDAFDPAVLPPGPLTVAFAAHLLEHLRDPRVFLRAVARRLHPDGRLYVEVPDAENADPALVGPINLINQQHIHYYSLRSLTRLAESCGYDVVACRRLITGQMPRLQCLLRRAGPGTTAAAVTDHLALLRRRRAGLADRIMAALAQDGVAGLWGVGADCRRLLAEHPAVDAALSAEKLILFDAGLAGRILNGAAIRPPSAIAAFAGTVFLTPLLGDVRGKMRAFATASGFPAERVVDPFQ